MARSHASRHDPVSAPPRGFPARGRPRDYSAAQKTIHWLTALFIVGLVPVGLTMTGLDPSPLTDRLYELHKSAGVLVLLLVSIRIVVRLTRGAPPVVEGIPAWQRAAAHGSHLALYILLVLVPLAGLTATSMCCAPVRLFWTIPVTLPVSGSMETAERIFAIHGAMALTLAALATIHAAAALHHHFIRRDGTLRRMLARDDRTNPA